APQMRALLCRNRRKLALGIYDDQRARQMRDVRYDQAGALVCAGRPEGEEMFRAFVAQAHGSAVSGKAAEIWPLIAIRSVRLFSESHAATFLPRHRDRHARACPRSSAEWSASARG